MADSEWATVPTKADREKQIKKKKSVAAVASTGTGACAVGTAGPSATPTMNVTGAATPGSRMLSTFQFLDDEEDIEAMRAKQRRALAAAANAKAQVEADELARAAALTSAGGAGKKKKPSSKQSQSQSQSLQPSQPTQKLPAAAAALDPGAVASFVADLQARYGGGPASEALVLGGLADFLLRHFARASGVERWAAALHAAAAADGASLVVVGGGGAAASAAAAATKKGAKATSSSSSSASAAATAASLVHTPHADLPAPLANALGSFAASCGARALGQVVDDLVSAAADGASARPPNSKPGQPASGPAPNAGVLVLLSSILRARPEALLAALPALQRRAVRPTAPGGGGGGAAEGGGPPTVPPLLSPGALPLTLWVLAQVAAAGEPAVALAAWCRLVLPALLGEEALPELAAAPLPASCSSSLLSSSAAPSALAPPPPDAMDARGRAAALAFGEALLTAVDGGSAEGPGRGGALSFFGPGAALRRQQQQQRSRPLDARLGDGLGEEVAVVPGSSVELVSRAAFFALEQEQDEVGSSAPAAAGRRRVKGLDRPLLARLAALHPRLQAAAARSALPGQFREWLCAAVVQSGGAAAAAASSSSSSCPSPLAERAAAAAALCLAADASCFALWADELHATNLAASAAVLSALDEPALAPVLAAPALKQQRAGGGVGGGVGSGGSSKSVVPLGGAPAARELFSTRLPTRHRAILLGGGGGGGGGGKASSATGASSSGQQQQQQQKYRLAAAEAEAACERLACGRALGAGALYRASGGDEARAAAQRLLGGAADGTAAAAGGGKKQRRRYKGGKQRRGPRRRGSFAGAVLRWALVLALLAALCVRHRRDDALAALAAAAGPKAAARADALFFRPLQEAVLRAEAAAYPLLAPLADRAREVAAPAALKARAALSPLIEQARPRLEAAVAAARPAVRGARLRVERLVNGRDAAAGEALAKAAAVARAAFDALALEARGIVERGRAAAMRDRARDRVVVGG